MFSGVKMEKSVAELGHSDPGIFPFKQLIHPWFSNLICNMTRLHGFRTIKFSLDENKETAKPLKPTFSPEPYCMFW